MSYCDFDAMPEVFSSVYPVSRKTYVCCECGVKIHPGEKYGRHWGVWDKESSTYRQHADCESACVFIKNEFQDGNCICFGELVEVWREYASHHAYDEQDGRKFTEKEKKFRSIMARVRSRVRLERKRERLENQNQSA